MFDIPKKQAITLTILTVGTFIAVLNQMIVAPALPTIMEEMSVSASTVQWLTTGFTLVNAVMVPMTGYLTDRFSMKSLFLTFMSVFAAGTLLAAWGPTFVVLLIGRLTQAVGAGVLMPMVMTVLLLTFPLEKRGTAMGVFNVIIAFAPTLGPVVAGVVIDRLNWHIMFVVVAALALISVIVGAIFLEKGEGGDPNVHGIDKLSVVLSTLGFGGMLYGFSSMGNQGMSISAAVMIAIGVLLTVLFVARQLKLEVPMLRVQVLKNRTFSIATIISMLVQAATLANVVLIPLFVQTVSGQSATISALVMLPGSIMAGILGPICGRLFDKHGPRALVITGLVLAVGGTICMSTLAVGMNIWLVALYCFIRLTGLSLINMPVTTWGMNALANRDINHGNAVNNSLRQVAGSLGTAIIISAYSLFSASRMESMELLEAQTAGINFAFMIQSVLLFAGLVIAIIFVRQQKGAAAQVDEADQNKALIEQLMDKRILTMPADGKVVDAANLFAAHTDADNVLLVNADGSLAGVVSDGDIMRALRPKRNGSYVDPLFTLVGDLQVESDMDKLLDDVMAMSISSIATSKVISIDVCSSMQEVVRVMGENHLRKAPVIENGKTVGVISRTSVTNLALRNYLARANARLPL